MLYRKDRLKAELRNARDLLNSFTPSEVGGVAGVFTQSLKEVMLQPIGHRRKKLTPNPFSMLRYVTSLGKLTLAAQELPSLLQE
jgi:hypothetical protein